MVVLEEMGFSIIRIREGKSDNEFIIYDKKKNEVNFYSKKRLVEILLMELEDKKINWRQFMTEHQTPINWIKEQIEAEIILLDNVGFKPIENKTFVYEGKEYFNLYKIPETLKYSNYKLDKPMTYKELTEKAPNTIFLLRNLHEGNDEAVKNTLLKLADKVKNPDRKSQDCIIFYPGEGAGKGVFYETIIKGIFGKYTSKILMKKLVSDFNGFLKQSLVVVLEEGKRDLDLIEVLKEITTEPEILINEKGKNAGEMPIFFLTFVFSNNMNPIDLGKRRGTYHIANTLGRTLEETQKKGQELSEKIPNEIDHLLYYLHNLEFNISDVFKPFNTIAKSMVIDLNKSPLELFYDSLLTYPSIEYACQDYNRERYKYSSSVLNLDIQKKPNEDGVEEEYISKEHIKRAYNNFCQIHNLKTNLIRHNKDLVQLWSLFQVPLESFLRIVINSGEYAGRKLDHVKLSSLNDKLKESIKEK